MTNHNAGIIGMGHAYPEGILTNADLEKMVETSDEWITTRTGIKQRHKAADNEYTSQFGTTAAKQALERAGLKPEDIDIIVCATTTPDQIMPSTGALIQAQIGAVNAAGMDVFAACSGFIYGLTMVESMIRTGQIKYALVIGAEVLTKYVDYTDRGTCVIFGDGAGAAVLGPVNSEAREFSRQRSNPTAAMKSSFMLPAAARSSARPTKRSTTDSISLK